MSAEIQIMNRGEVVASPQQQSDSGAIIAMIERAARDPAVDVDKFERLMALKERAEAQAAKKAFNAAISAAKGEIGPVLKNKTVDFTSQKGRTNYRHEDFAEVARTVDPVLNKYGLSYRFKTTQAGAKLTVTCIVSHADGFSEETTLESGEDHSGNKNSIQAIGSAATYLQRYTLKLALGLAASDKDDDGAGMGSPELISDGQREQLQNRIMEVGADPVKFTQWLGVEKIADLPVKDFQRAMTALDVKARKDK